MIFSSIPFLYYFLPVVLLAYGLAPHLGETGIWMAIPIGWALADAVGLGYMRRSLHGLEPAAD